MLEQLFIDHVRKNNLFGGAELLIAVSGGIDSVVLCELLHANNLSFEMAHANFGLRGQESDEDEQFVKSLARKYNARMHLQRFDTDEYASVNKVSTQVAARELRYEWFRQLVIGRNAVIVTAHHTDDNIETVLMHFFRGTGISGLRGMQERSGNLVRPLLTFTKKQLVNYAQEKKLKWREDSSNITDKYTRNYFRNNVIPLVKKVFPEAEANIIQNTRRIAEAEILYEEAIRHHIKKLVVKKGEEWQIPALKLKKMPAGRSVLFEIVRHLGFTAGQLNDLFHLTDAENGKMVLSATHRVLKNREWLIISPLHDLNVERIVIGENETKVKWPVGELEVNVRAASSTHVSRAQNEAMLDLAEVKYPLIIRKWKAGDYFYPLGMPKKKKVARFMIDQKLSKAEKENMWIIESDKRICWVIGLRIDHRFRVKENTRTVLHMRMKPL